MAVGDRLIQPVSPTTGAAYAPYEVTNETSDSSGFKQAALLVKQVGDAGETLNAPSAALYSGSQATSTTAAALNGGTSQAVSEVLVTNTDASISMLVGNATTQATPLPAGASIVIPVDNLNKVYVKSASGTPTVAWLGRS